MPLSVEKRPLFPHPVGMRLSVPKVEKSRLSRGEGVAGRGIPTGCRDFFHAVFYREEHPSGMLGGCGGGDDRKAFFHALAVGDVEKLSRRVPVFSKISFLRTLILAVIIGFRGGRRVVKSSFVGCNS